MTKSGAERAFEAVRSGDAEALDAVLKEQPEAARARDENGVSLLLHALYHRRGDLADRILAEGIEPDLFEAAAQGRTERVIELLDTGTLTVGHRSADGFTALHLAAFFGHPETVEALLSRGADAEAAAENPSEVRPLHSAVAGRNPHVVRVLLAAEPDLEARQQGGFTPLMGAAANGLDDLVDLLLAAGADPTTTDDECRTAADLARAKGKDATAERLESADD